MMTISQQIQSQLEAYKNAGDAAGYYSTLAANGHDYGNLALEAATDTGFWGHYANNFLENKAAELNISIDRDKIMQELMQADFEKRAENHWEQPITAEAIKKYHQYVFEKNGLPPSAWTGTFFDDRFGPAMWCINCNGIERQGQTVEQALSNFVDNMLKDWNGTFDQAIDFFTDALRDGVLSKTIADAILDATGRIELAKAVELLLQRVFDWAQEKLDIADLINQFWNAARNWIQRIDPLALDLNNNGIETIAANGTVLFDHDGDGIKHGTGWLKPTDGWLVLDRNNNNLIDSGKELFGVDTVKSNGQKATDAFDALKDLDANVDEKIDASDSVFNNLRVWQDLNQNGISEANELTSLSANNITAINLTATVKNTNLGNGNVEASAATFIRTDGSSGELVEVSSAAINDHLYTTSSRDLIAGSIKFNDLIQRKI